MKYVLGLDLGITSIGWAIYNMDNNSIEKCGVRLFDAAETPKDKSSLAAPRREARGQRRRIRRRAYRMKAIRQLLIKNCLITQDELNNLFNSNNKNNAYQYDVYYLRFTALTTLLTNQQLVQVLIHLSKHRGFKSNRKEDKSISKDNDKQKVNSSLKINSELLKNYQTVADMFINDPKFIDKKRNTTGDYRCMVLRSDVEAEGRKILNRQFELGNKLITQEFIEHYIEIFNWQKPFDWQGNIRNKVGRCQFEKDEFRAAKACFSSEKFIALSKLNNIYYTIDSVKYHLSVTDIQAIFAKALIKKSGLNFNDIRNQLSMPVEARFNFVKYNKFEDFLDAEKKEVIKELKLPAYHEMKNAIEKYCGITTWNNLVTNFEFLDQIIVELTYNKTDETIKSALQKLFTTHHQANKFTLDDLQQIINAVICNGVSFDKNINLSIKALYKIIPFLEQGNQYDKACCFAGYNHTMKDVQRYPRLPSIQQLGLDNELTNPVVIRAISQLRKIVNAVVDKFGQPYQINIELARDIGRSAKQRLEIEKQNEANKDNNERLFKDFSEKNNNNAPKGDELTKFKLWKQQNCRCIYSDEYINFESLLRGANFTQIDHIIPYSRSFDDSLTNKVLCLTSQNQAKANQTPYEYIGASGHNIQQWHMFEERCKSIAKSGRMYGFSHKKLEFLLQKKIDEGKFIERNLNDTRYISRFCQNYLANYLQFADKSNKKPVRSLTGQATAFIRNHWGLRKSREENDLHHAQDACVIAAFTTSMEQKIGYYMRAKDYGRNQDLKYIDNLSGEVFDMFPRPHINFKKEVEQKVKEIFVSRMPKRGISGAFHLDTIRSRRYVDKPFLEYNNGKPFSTITKTLADSGIKLNKDGEIDKICPTYKQHNPNIYELLQDQLNQHDNDCKKAFTKTIFAPRTDGTPSNIQIKTIKIMQPQNTGVLVNKGISDNGSMVRIDIFNKNDKNYIVPIYLSDVNKRELPNKAIIANKHESEWEIIDASYRFLFSFYPRDLIKIITKKEVYFGYYIGADRANASLTVLLHDGAKEYKGIGIKIGTMIEKYQVDVLGNYTKVVNEKRLDFSGKKS